MGSVLNSSHSLIESLSGHGITDGVNGNIVGFDPKLGSLADNGGPTQTHALQSGSPAIDAGQDLSGNGITTDQRGESRPKGDAYDMGSFEWDYIKVLNTNDDGPGSLRDAVENSPIGSFIIFDNNLNGETIRLTSGQITINKSMTIDTQGKNITVSRTSENEFRIFEITPDNTVVINGLSNSNGSADSGGGVFNRGTLKIDNTTISGNTADKRGGGVGNVGTLTIENSTISDNGSSNDSGGIRNDGNMTIINSTINGNTADDRGGGVGNVGTLTIENSTISGNTADTADGGVGNVGTLTIENSTISGNTSNTIGGIFAFGTETILNSIIANNKAGTGPDISNIVEIAENNLIGSADGDHGITDGVNGNIVGVDPKLDLLANNGGPTFTHALLPGSPAIDAGIDLSGDGITTDQRGESRSQGSAFDIGAYESDYYIVRNNEDSGSGSLRQAIHNAELNGGVENIQFDTNLNDTIITLSSGELVIVDDMTIDGFGQNITISGGNNSRVLRIGSGSNVSLIGLTITEGNADGSGGGIFNDGGNLTIESSTITANNAIGNFFDGGGIFNKYGIVNLINSTVSHNTAEGQTADGGGIMNLLGTLTLTNSTIFGNHAIGISSDGGGISNEGILNIVNSTISENKSDGEGGGIWNKADRDLNLISSTVSENISNEFGGGIFSQDNNTYEFIQNSIIAKNISTLGGDDIYSPDIDIAENNLIKSPDGHDIQNGVEDNIIGQDPHLGRLAFNGGPTQTHALLPDSPAIDAGLDLSLGGITTDQRGVSRPKGSAYDIGAFEFSYVIVTNTNDEGEGSLRQAITDASNGDSILFADNLEGQTIGLTSGNITINKSIIIDTQGKNIEVSRTGENEFQIFEIQPDGIVIIDGLTISNGSASDGGGILNFGDLTLNNSTVSGNHAANFGGGIINDGNLAITNSTINGNTSSVEGGGIWNYVEGNLILINSTVSGNIVNGDGSRGGSIYNLNNLTVSNSTISSNSANDQGGGGIYNRGSLILTNSILAHNTSPSSHDIFNDGGTLNSSYSLVESPDGHDIQNGVDGNIVGVDPLLEPLVNNGGPTLTHALQQCSPAIDMGDPNLSYQDIPTDQRGNGYDRVKDGDGDLTARIDIGAYEAVEKAPNGPPEIVMAPVITANEGSPIEQVINVVDPDGDSVFLTVDIGEFSSIVGNQRIWQYTPSDGPTEIIVTLTADDNNCNLTEEQFTLTVNNVAPTIINVAGHDQAIEINTPVLMSAEFSDPAGDFDMPYSATWNWGDGTTSPGIITGYTITGEHQYAEANLYDIVLTAIDKDGGSTSRIMEDIAIYDRNGGFVTGSGWIDSPVGSLKSDDTITGKTQFAFSSKYNKNDDLPNGETKIKWKEADLEFKSTSQEVVVVVDENAVIKGIGELNGVDNYEFLISVIDADLTDAFETDLLRIKIWNRETGEIIYDSQVEGDTEDSAQPTIEIGAGNITINTSK